LIASIKVLASYPYESKINNEEKLITFLKSWWSDKYNRPLKDPLLLSYTLEELLYEFHDKIKREEHKNYDSIGNDSDQNVLDDEALEESIEWIKEQEKIDLQQIAKETENKELASDLENDLTIDGFNVDDEIIGE
jgi:hypothetical protein